MAGQRRHKGGGHEEAHENHERWLLTYADMITLLMVLFIVMFAMSTVDAKKFEQLKQSLAGAFGGSQTPIEGGASQGGATDGVSPAPVDLRADGAGGGTADPQLTSDEVQKAVLQADRATASQNHQAAQEEVERLQEIRDKMIAALAAEGLEQYVQFVINERGLVVNVVTTSVIFGGDSAVLLGDGQRTLRALSPALAAVPNQLEISGHTNQLPVPTIKYPSGWELSTARASSVVRYLLRFPGMVPARMTATGHSDQRPLYPPSDPLSVTRNRRVEVAVLSDQPPEVRALLETVANAEAEDSDGEH